MPTSASLSGGDWRAAVPVLKGATFTLRELRTEDAASLFALLTTAEVARFISPPPTTVEGFERFIAWSVQQRAAGNYIGFAIVPHGMTTAIGLFQIRSLEPGFGLETALMPITMAILGGSGLLIGPVVGVVFLSLVQEVLWTQLGVLRLASLGLVLVLVGLFMPGGLVRLPPVYRHLRRWGLVQEG